MRPRSVITATVMLAAAGGLTAVTLPATAGDQEPTEPARSPGASPSRPEQPDQRLLAALQRDLGLTEEQAVDRLATEEWARQTTTELRDELGADRYAGAWLSADGTGLTVAVTDSLAAARVQASGATATRVRYGEAALTETMTTLDGYTDSVPEAVVGWYLDPPTNQVVVLTAEGADQAAYDFAASAGATMETVRVVGSDEQPRLRNDLRGGDPYLIAGAGRCSVGFPVVGAVPELDGFAGFVTAGHCALAGFSGGVPVDVSTSALDGTPQGEFVAGSFPGVGAGGPDDWAVVQVNDDWVPLPEVTDFAGGVLPVAGSQVATVGSAVCKFGSTTGVSCGTIRATDATVVYPEGIVTGLTRTDACAEPGDSGGSWLAGDQAQGVTSGGSGDCTVGGVTFFQPLLEVLELNQLALVTTGDA